MIDELKILRFVNDLNKLSYKKNYNIKVTHVIKDDDIIIIFKKENKKFGLRYDKINHLTFDNILEWASSNFYAKDAFKFLEDSLNKLRKGEFDDYERDFRD